MPDVFISYSRTDQAFVQRLHEALERRDIDVWVDWEDIPATTDWFDRISAGIRESDAFAFVMTPASLGSDVCARELDYAVELGKRIVPILHEDLGDLAVPASLARLQWIAFTQWSDEAVAQLVDALQSDPEWLQAHTRWLQFADRWQRSNRDPSTLLRGSELRAAEAWLATEGAEARDPPPTPLQFEYVLASRRAETRRQRMLRGAVTFGLVIALALAAIALIQRGRAVAESEEARSRALAASSFLSLSTDPELSMLLAREALDIKYTEQAEDALRQSLIESRVRGTLTGHQEALRDLAFSPDGDRLVTGSDDYSARIWDLGTAETVAVLSGHTQPVHDVEYSPDGTLIATLAADFTARLWDPESGENVAVLRDRADPRLADAEFSPDGSLLATTGFVHNQVKLWDTETGGLVHKLPVKTVDRAAFSPDGAVLLTASQSSPPAVWDVGTGRRLAEFPAGFVDSSYSDAEYSPNGEYIALANGGVGLDVNVSLLRNTGELVAGLRHGNSVSDLAFDSRGRLLATASDNSTARVWRVSDGEPLATMSGHADPVTSVSFSDDGKLLVTGSNDGTARLWDVRTGRAVAELRGHSGAIAHAEFSPDGQSVATASRDGVARIWSGSETGGAFDKLATDRVGSSVGMSANGDFITRMHRGAIEVLDAATSRVQQSALPEGREDSLDVVSDEGTLVATIPNYDVRDRDETTRVYAVGSDDPPVELDTPVVPSAAAFSPDGGLIALSGEDSYVAVWSTEDGELVTELEVPEGSEATVETPGITLTVVPDSSVEFSGDGARVATSSSDGTARVWDARSGELLRTVEAFLEGPERMLTDTTATLSADGTRLATAASYEDVARVWDVDTGEQLAELRGHAGGVVDVAFGAGDSFVVTGGADGVVRVWETETGRTLIALRGQQYVYDVAFSSDGSTLRALDYNRLVSYGCIVCGPVSELEELSDQRATRELSALESSDFVEID
jgi:WD40 repeat protein